MTVETRQQTKCVLADLAATVLAILLFNICRYEWFIDNIGAWSLIHFLTSRTILTGWILFPLMMVCIYYLSGAYYNVMTRSRLDELVNTFLSNAIGSLIIYFTILIDDIVDDKATIYEMLGCLWLCMTLFVGSERMYLTSRLIQRVRAHRLGYNTLIVGVTQAAINMADRISNPAKAHGFNIVGYINPTFDSPTSDDIKLPVYHISEIENVIKELNVVNLIVMPHRDGIHATMRLINDLFPLGKSILISPVLMHVISGKSTFGNVSGEPLIDVSHPDISPSTASCKRAADIVISALALVLLTPVFIAIAAAIKIKSPDGSILYRQERVGFRKKHFKIIKFRTMRPDAEENGPALSSPDDPRITPFGRFLRKYRLDELPQFWNVLKGDMSLVGTRPPTVDEYGLYQSHHKRRLSMKPGISGLWQVSGRSDIQNFEEVVRLDVAYIDNWSLWLDIKILFKTLVIVFTGEGAR